MKNIEYVNGVFYKADIVSPTVFGVIDNDIFKVECIGCLYKSKPTDLAIDALKQLNNSLPYGKEIIFNIIVDSYDENKDTGYFTKYVVFQGLYRTFI